jgi:hypothetical protein
MDTPNLPEQTQVVVVGAGPTGLALACSLMARGVDVVAVDRAAEGAHTSRAAVVHARTLEVLDEIDVSPELVRLGVIVPHFVIRDRDSTLFTVPFERLPTRYPYTLMVPQDVTERVLADRLGTWTGRCPAERSTCSSPRPDSSSSPRCPTTGTASWRPRTRRPNTPRSPTYRPSSTPAAPRGAARPSGTSCGAPASRSTTAWPTPTGTAGCSWRATPPHVHSPAGGQGMNTGIQDAARRDPRRRAHLFRPRRRAGRLRSRPQAGRPGRDHHDTPAHPGRPRPATRWCGPCATSDSARPDTSRRSSGRSR